MEGLALRPDTYALLMFDLQIETGWCQFPANRRPSRGEREKRRSNALVEEFAEEGERRKDEDAQVELSEQFAFGRWET